MLRNTQQYQPTPRRRPQPSKLSPCQPRLRAWRHASPLTPFPPRTRNADVSTPQQVKASRTRQRVAVACGVAASGAALAGGGARRCPPLRPVPPPLDLLRGCAVAGVGLAVRGLVAGGAGGDADAAPLRLDEGGAAALLGVGGAELLCACGCVCVCVWVGEGWGVSLREMGSGCEQWNGVVGVDVDSLCAGECVREQRGSLEVWVRVWICDSGGRGGSISVRFQK